MLDKSCTLFCIEILQINKYNKIMIPSIIEVVSYTSIICMILLYDTMHYDQPNRKSALPRAKKCSILDNLVSASPKQTKMSLLWKFTLDLKFAWKLIKIILDFFPFEIMLNEYNRINILKDR
jgi:hypothetical protein